LTESGDAQVIDAEVVEPDDENRLETGSDSPEDAMRDPDGGGNRDRDMPLRRGPRSGQLMTLEDAADANRAAVQVHRLKKRC
jgi:hypothetical protein